MKQQLMNWNTKP